MACTHAKTFSLYRRLPRSQGGAFTPDAARCAACGKLLERDAAAARRAIVAESVADLVSNMEKAERLRKLEHGRQWAKKKAH